MNNNKTQILIDRYLNGVTTPDEEKQLARALLRDDIPDDWKVVRIMLGELAMGEAEYDADVAKDAPRKKTFVLPVPVRWLAAAGIVLLLGFVCFNHIGHDEEKVVAKVETGSASEQKDNNAMSEKEPPVSQSVNHHAAAGHDSDDNNLQADNAEQYISGSQPEHDNDTEDAMPDYSAPLDGNLHYASLVTKDTLDNYQPPSRMEEFIVKMADYHRVKGESLACTPNKNDSLTVSKAYVFEDTKDLNLFSRLLQAACWYDDTTPGYLLNYSHQQFFFRLEDLRQKTQYLWIAERVRGKILLYSTHSPLGTDVSSDCFREYRDKLSNTSTQSITKKI